MKTMRKTIPFGRAICYSGYREGQSPKTNIPSLTEIKEDLEILVNEGYRYIRLYDPNLHAERVLQVITEEKLPLKCIIGIDSDPEENNLDCPFEEQNYSEEELRQHAIRNDGEIEKLITLVKKYSDLVMAVSVGNENTPHWSAHRVSEDRLIHHAKRLKEELTQPVTFCDGYYEWEFLKNLAEELDIISIHSYPYHYGTKIEDAIAQNQSQYKDIQEMYPGHQIIITELGWSTNSTKNSHRAIIRDQIKEIFFDPDEPKRASLENAKYYYEELNKWIEDEKVIAFYFEAFDELWKGSSIKSSECNFGIYNNDRERKY